MTRQPLIGAVFMGFSLKTITDKLQGRTTSFLAAYFVIGHILAWTHRLDGQYIAFFMAFMGFVVGKGYSDDKHEQNMTLINQQQPGPDSQQVTGSPPELSGPPQGGPG
jgi:hypothetical protein